MEKEKDHIVQPQAVIEGTTFPDPLPRRGLFSRLLGFLRKKDQPKWTVQSEPSINWASTRGNFDPAQAYAGRKPTKKGKAETKPLENRPAAERAPELTTALTDWFPMIVAKESRQHPAYQTTVDELLPVLKFLRDEAGLEYSWPQQVHAIDWPEQNELELVYVLRRPADAKLVSIHLRVPRNEPQVPSATGLFAGFNWHERETYEMFGVQFQNHPDLRKLMLDSSYPGFPMLKGYTDEDHEFITRPY